jgi:hypothetical protein
MPNDPWYVLVGSQQHGPYPLAAMRQFMAEGRVTPQTMLRQGETGAGAMLATRAQRDSKHVRRQVMPTTSVGMAPILP